MRSSITSLILLAVTLPAHAQDNNTKPNTLTSKEIADGWILLFDGETTFGWSSFPAANKRIAVANDSLVSGPGGLGVPIEAFPFELQFDYRVEDPQLPAAVNVVPSFSHTLEPGDNKRWGHVTFRQDGAQLFFKLQASGEKRPIEVTHDLAAKMVRSSTSFTVCGKLLLRNLKLRPSNSKPLFNNKDLTGWKAFPGDKYKSNFTATDKGELNVKNGPGDLQTVGKYQDFVLQLECISHGKHLNSGIFFRCRDNEYQNGYEAQIRNQFTPEATQDYLIEVYDPMTHKLAEKKKIQSTAVDYGTGGIYRRQPARKEMAKDGEWFAMTIVAHGNHLATWVNGVQVADWHDNRPESDNARTGCKLGAGHISIQGHDATTNLSFRNIRIAEWPK